MSGPLKIRKVSGLFCAMLDHAREMFLWADDAVIVIIGTTDGELSDTLTSAISAVSICFDDDMLSLNVENTKCMYMGTAIKIKKADFLELVCKDEIDRNADSIWES